MVIKVQDVIFPRTTVALRTAVATVATGNPPCTLSFHPAGMRIFFHGMSQPAALIFRD
ncbi:hypothetical protein PHLCEN_2v12531 [Hermanssonia centrifuga]|uniref:Uncharacterized protein n=1 Tax=Hermanssonia centrifuga TaxID=98765 RepID=A0A2R6NGS4_9APHY|nr:hypothetical protein PHLCEN_2v12531 [Hermanssonia centrifuga]